MHFASAIKSILVLLLACFWGLLEAQAQPTWCWAEEIATLGLDGFEDLAVDSLTGDIYAVGYFGGDLSAQYPLGLNNTPDLSVPFGNVDGLVAKHDSAGQAIWALKIGGPGGDVFVSGVSIGPGGNIYVCGRSTGNVQFQGVSTSASASLNSASENAFIAAYDSDGNLLWLREGSGTGNYRGLGITADANRIYACGRYRFADITLNGGGNPNVTLANLGGADGWIASYSFGGDLLWVDAVAGTTNNETAKSLASDGVNLYVAGRYRSNPVTFFPTGLTLNNIGLRDCFAASYNAATGTVNWVQRMGGTVGDEANSIAVDADGVYVVGYMDDAGGTLEFPGGVNRTSGNSGEDIFVCKLFKANGLTDWAVVTPNNSGLNAAASEVIADQKGRVYYGGSMTGTTQFNGGLDPQISNGLSDAFVSCLSNTGTYQWTAKSNGGGIELLFGLSWDITGAIYGAGSFGGGTVFGTNVLPGSALGDGFLAKLDCQTCDAGFSYTQSAYCSTSPNVLPTITGDSGGTFINPSGNISIVNALTGEISPSTSTPGGPDTIIYTSPAACRDTFLITIDAPPSSANAGVDQNTCSFGTTLNGNVPLVGTGLWTVAAGSGVISTPSAFNTPVTALGLGANEFAWTISNGACPSESDTVRITVAQSPSVSMAGPDQSTCGISALLAANAPLVGNGSWNILTPGPTLSSNTDPNATANALVTGQNVFEWVISNSFCTPERDTVIVNVIPSPSAAIAGPDQNICGISATLAATAPSIGNGQWNVLTAGPTLSSNIDPNASVSGLIVGVNEFEWVVENAPCPSNRDTVRINVTAQPSPSAAGPDQNICGISALLAANAPLVGNGTWNILTPGPTLSSNSDPNATANALVTGQNVFEWVISSGSCTPERDTVIVNVIPSPSAAIAGPDQNICGTAATLAATAPSIGNGQWNVLTAGPTLSSNIDPNASVSGLIVGVNEFEWVVENAPCPSNRDTVRINVTAQPSPSAAGPDQNICGTTATLIANAPPVGMGSWNILTIGPTLSSNTDPNATANALVPGQNVFEWVISNGSCTPERDTVVIFSSIPPSPSFAGPDLEICDSTVTMSATAAAIGIGNWHVLTPGPSLSSSIDPNATVSNLPVGVSRFEWVVSNGTCPAERDTVQINRYRQPLVDLGPDSLLCAGDSLLLDAGHPLMNHLWSTGDNSQTISVSSSGSYSVTVTNVVCVDADTIVAGFVALPSVNLGADQSLCPGDSVLLDADNPGAQFLWSDGSTGQTNWASQIGPVSVAVTNGCGTVSDTLDLSHFPLPIVDLGPDSTLCSGASYLLDAGNPGMQYLWSTGGSGQTILVTQTGNYSVTVTSLDGCMATDNVFIGAGMGGASIQITGLDSNYCEGDAPTTLFGLPIGGQFSGPGVSGNSFSPLAGTIGQTTIYYSYQDSLGCLNVDSSSTEVFPAVLAEAGADRTLHFSEEIALDGNSPLPGTGFWQVISGNAVLGEPSSPNSMLSNLSEGEIRLLWSISFGPCFSSDELVIIKETFQPERAFSPNDDGINDRFVIPDLESYPGSSLQVFNRWGQVVFESADYQNDWRGTNQDGSALPNDTYFYVLKVGGETLVKSHVALQR